MQILQMAVARKHSQQSLNLVMPTPRELADLAASLKLKIQQNKLRLRRAGVSTDLPSEILQALDLLESRCHGEIAQTGSDSSQGWASSPLPSPVACDPPRIPAKYLKRLSHRIESAIESALETAMQPWQSELSQATSRCVDMLKALQESSSTIEQFRQDYESRSARLERQQEQLAVELEKAQSLQWRLARQRKSLAQSIRAQRAEIQLAMSSGNVATQDQHIQLKELARQLSESQDQLLRSANKLSDQDALLSERNRQLEAALQDVAEKESQITSQRDQLEQAITRSELLQQAMNATLDDEDELPTGDGSSWKIQLEQAQAELADLREQNSELASRIAHLTAGSLSNRKNRGTVNPELLSWDERKKLMLQQLEQDDGLDAVERSAESGPGRLEMQDVIAATQQEIERRDREIEELREIIQLQSEARQGVAIGAAGVAQLLDSNELINEERRKLQVIQQEWESKLRQAEIDLSMERAKLARERSELESELAQIKRDNKQGQHASNGSDKQERRWKNFLGIKEESSD